MAKAAVLTSGLFLCVLGAADDAAKAPAAPATEQDNFGQYMGAYLPPGDNSYTDKWLGKKASFRGYMDKYSSGYANYTKYTSQYGGKAANYQQYVTMYAAMAGQKQPDEKAKADLKGDSVKDNFGAGYFSPNSGEALRAETQPSNGGGKNDPSYYQKNFANWGGEGKKDSAGAGGGAGDYQQYMQGYEKYIPGGAGGAKGGSSDYADYSKYTKDYQQYMGGAGAGGQGGAADYQQYMNKYTGNIPDSGDAKTATGKDVDSSAGYGKYQQEYAGGAGGKDSSQSNTVIFA